MHTWSLPNLIGRSWQGVRRCQTPPRLKKHRLPTPSPPLTPLSSGQPVTSFFSHADRNHAVPKPPALLAHCYSRTTCRVAPPLAPDPTHLEGFRKPGTTRSSTSLAPPTMDSRRSPTQDPPLSLRLHPQRHCYREPRAPPTFFRAGTFHRSPRPRSVHQNLPSQSRAARVKPLTTLFIPSSTLQEPATGISSFCAGSCAFRRSGSAHPAPSPITRGRHPQPRAPPSPPSESSLRVVRRLLLRSPPAGPVRSVRLWPVPRPAMEGDAPVAAAAHYQPASPPRDACVYNSCYW